jgi:transcriptional regulator of acetoin/glycerol metabolism
MPLADFAVRYGDDLPTLERVLRDYTLHVLAQLGGNVSRAAVSLGVSRFTLHRNLRKWGLSSRDYKAAA